MNKVLVIGDSCKDEFRYGSCDRLSPEAPVPIFHLMGTIKNSGMALNVFENLRALGVGVDLITNKDRPTKIRYVDETSNQMLLRVDVDDIVDPVNNDRLKNIDYSLYDAVVISDYNKGFLSTKNILEISKKHPTIFLDTKKNITPWADNVEFIKINQKEYNANEEYLRCDYEGDLIVTMGNYGAILNNKQRFSINDMHDVRDLSGAGDTFLAALVASYIKNNDICEAINFANRCASWVVTQRGVTIVDINEIK